MKRVIFIFAAIILVLGAGIFVYFQYFRSDDTTTNNATVFCTDDAKICPDGTAVGRTGPNCEFAPCSE